MSVTRTLRQMADTFNDLDALSDPKERERRYQKMRVLSQKDVFSSNVPVSKGKTAEYAERTVCLVRLLMVLYEIGFDADALRLFQSFMEKTYFPLKPSVGRQPSTSLDAAIEGIRRGEEWNFSVMARRHCETGKLYYTGGFRDETIEQSKEGFSILDAEGSVHAVVSISAKALMAPLLSKQITPGFDVGSNGGGGDG